MTDKDPDAYRTISEVSEALDIPPHVLRFWETKFPQIRPLKRGGGRRFYRRADVDVLRVVRRLLYEDGYTIRGVQRLFRSKGAGGAAALERGTTTETVGAAEADSTGPQAPTVPIESEPARAMIAWLASEIAACQAILSDGRQAHAVEDRPGT